MKTTAARKTVTFVDNGFSDRTHDQDRDEFDQLVVLACRGNRRAIGAIAAALGPTLLEEARTILGKFDQEAEDVLEDFLLCLVDRRLRFVPAHGRAMPWMCGIVHAIAQQRRREREWEWRIDREHK
jgi:hypothetical protein